MAIEYNPPTWTSGDDEKISFYKTSNDIITDLTGYSGRLHIRNSSGKLLIESIAEIESNIVKFRFSSTDTGIFRDEGAGKYLYDAELTSPTGEIKTELKGYIEVELDITREGIDTLPISANTPFVSKIGVR